MSAISLKISYFFAIFGSAICFFSISGVSAQNGHTIGTSVVVDDGTLTSSPPSPPQMPAFSFSSPSSAGVELVPVPAPAIAKSPIKQLRNIPVSEVDAQITRFLSSFDGIKFLSSPRKTNSILPPLIALDKGVFIVGYNVSNNFLVEFTQDDLIYFEKIMADYIATQRTPHQHVRSARVSSDFDRNKNIDIADYKLMLLAFKTEQISQKVVPVFDLNSDGTIDIDDFSILAHDWTM